jgi:anti-sigma-K factor RskA
LAEIDYDAISPLPVIARIKLNRLLMSSVEHQKGSATVARTGPHIASGNS